MDDGSNEKDITDRDVSYKVSQYYLCYLHLRINLGVDEANIIIKFIIELYYKLNLMVFDDHYLNAYWKGIYSEGVIANDATSIYLFHPHSRIFIASNSAQNEWIDVFSDDVSDEIDVSLKMDIMTLIEMLKSSHIQGDYHGYKVISHDHINICGMNIDNILTQLSNINNAILIFNISNKDIIWIIYEPNKLLKELENLITECDRYNIKYN